jgi:hypothetical protein
MRIALCIGNLAAKGRQGKTAYVKGYEHIKEKILDKNKNVDVFLHSYEPELKDELVGFYNPVSFLFEEMPNFEEEYKDLDFNYCNYNSQQTYSYQNLFSMAYSRYRVGQLKSNYEKENNFIYDWVIFVRYDISSANHIEEISFDSSLDFNYLYSCMFNQLNAGPQDQWFYSNSKDMDIVFSLYKDLKKYFSTNSEFAISATNNWIDSNVSDRTSNEIFKNEEDKIKIGERMPVGAISNGHVIYKWHMYVNNLWDLKKLKFIISKDSQIEFYKGYQHNNIIVLY